jgi:hypothetical protein
VRPRAEPWLMMTVAKVKSLRNTATVGESYHHCGHGLTTSTFHSDGWPVPYILARSLQAGTPLLYHILSFRMSYSSLGKERLAVSGKSNSSFNRNSH